MMVRAIICCVALILGLLATLGATAAEKARPLDLMAFMRGGAKTSAKPATTAAAAKPGKHRRGTGRSAPRPEAAPRSEPEDAPRPEPDKASSDVATLLRPAPLPAAAAAFASHAENDVQVVASEELNSIDLAMLRSSPETVGATPKIDAKIAPLSAEIDQVQNQARAAVANSDNAAPSPGNPASRGDPHDEVRDDSWMGRIWSAVGDGFVALVTMVRQLFG